jgi:flagellin
MTSINTNIGAMVAQKNMMDNTKELDNAMARISSGLRINSAKDDAAGSAIASKMESQVRSLGVAIRNANDAISLTQTAEGALGEVENILQRMRELSVQAGNSTLNASDRSQIQSEMNQLAGEIDSISAKTNFNGTNLLNGSNAKVTMQIGINESDSLDIALQKTDVSSLGIGNTGSTSSNTLTTARIGAIGTSDIATTDIKINGKDWTATDFDVSSAVVTPAYSATQDVSGALAANSLQATAIAVKINENTGEHGVTARAYNEITSTNSSYIAADTVINAVTIQSRGTKAEFVAAINNEIAGLSATIGTDGKITLSNNTGKTIDLNSADFYGGFVELSSVDGAAISIESGSKINGYVSTTALTSQLAVLGLNEVSSVNDQYTIKGTSYVTSTQLTAADGLKINDVLITELSHHTTNSISATDKIAAINDKTAETGVVATGSNSILIQLDLAAGTIANASTASINGITINLSAATEVNEFVAAINAGLSGFSSTTASVDESTGKMRLSNTDGGTISFDDGTTSAAIFVAGYYEDGRAFLTATTGGAGTAYGFISLTSTNGSAIKISDGAQDGAADTGGNEIGFQSQNENATSTSGVNVSTLAGATTSLAALDKALDTIANFRAGFGAYENRLDASINNLTTLQINTDAARSRIEDADFAKETTNMTKSQILSQAATSMLAQANSSKQNLLALLQG